MNEMTALLERFKRRDRLALARRLSLAELGEAPPAPKHAATATGHVVEEIEEEAAPHWRTHVDRGG